MNEQEQINEEYDLEMERRRDQEYLDYVSSRDNYRILNEEL